MRIMSLSQFLAQAEEEQDTCSRTLRMPLWDLIACLQEFDSYEQDQECLVTVTLDCPVRDTITVSFNVEAADL